MRYYNERGEWIHIVKRKDGYVYYNHSTMTASPGGSHIMAEKGFDLDVKPYYPYKENPLEQKHMWKAAA